MRELQVTETSLISAGKCCIPAAVGVASIAVLAGVTFYIFRKKTKNSNTHHVYPRPPIIISSSSSEETE